MGRIVCVVNVTVVTAVVTCSAFWSAGASVSAADWTPTKAGTAPAALTPSAEVFTVKPVLLLATAGPVVNWPMAKVILEVPAGKTAVAVVQTMVNVAAVNVQVDVRAADPDTGTRVPAGVALPLK